jgi:sporulation protein YlmC with PRC-barrel domain
MAHYGTLAHFHFTDDVDDIRGAHLYGRDEYQLGKIKDVIFDHETGEIRYLVVQSGDRKVLVPSAHVFRTALDEKDFVIDMTREQFASLPDFDEKMLDDERRWLEHEQQHQEALSDWRKEQEQLYRERWHDGVVQHQHGSSHNVTPAPDELTQPADEQLKPPMGSMGEDLEDIRDTPPHERRITAADLTPQRLQNKFPEPQPSPSKTQLKPERPSREPGTATGSAGRLEIVREHSERWVRFEDLLRKNRVDIQAKCPACAPKKAA